MIDRTCAFTGHRIVANRNEISKKLKETVSNLYDKGYRFFGAGGALGFDTLAALAVLELRQKHEDMKLILVLPCINQTEKWKQSDIDLYEEIKNAADKVVYTSQNYTAGCMLKRNRHLVDNSSIIVSYLTQSRGGTYYTVNYAKKLGKQIINLA